jgi:ATP-dependent exoDNAse (exonuclease V) alpha subunit
LIEKIYGEITRMCQLPIEVYRKYLASRAILAPRNSEVDALNDKVLDKIPGEIKEYPAVDSAFQDGTKYDAIPQEDLAGLNLPGFPLSQLKLKIGASIMLLRNLDPAEGLCNGTRMIVTAMRERVIEATIAAGPFAGKRVFIPRVTLDSNPTAGLPFTLRRRQFPVRLAFAITINKAQGQSLQVVGLELRSEVFSHGQLYVALSRATDYRHVHILLGNEYHLTTNIVYKELLV